MTDEIDRSSRFSVLHNGYISSRSKSGRKSIENSTIEEQKSKKTINKPKIIHNDRLNNFESNVFGLDDLNQSLTVGSKELTNENMTKVMKEIFSRITQNEELNINKPEFISFSRINNYITFKFKFKNEKAWSVYNENKNAMEGFLIDKVNENFADKILDAEISLKKGSLEVEIVLKIMSISIKIMKLIADFLCLYSDTNDYINNKGNKSSIIKTTINIISSIFSMFFEKPITN